MTANSETADSTIRSETSLIPLTDRCLQWASKTASPPHNDPLTTCLMFQWRHQIMPSNAPLQLRNGLDTKNGLCFTNRPFPSSQWWRSQLFVEQSSLESTQQWTIRDPSTSTPTPNINDANNNMLMRYWRQNAHTPIRDPALFGGSFQLYGQNGLRMQIYPSNSQDSTTATTRDAQRVPWYIRLVTYQRSAYEGPIPTAVGEGQQLPRLASDSVRSNFLTFQWFPEWNEVFPFKWLPRSVRVRLFDNPVEDSLLWVQRRHIPPQQQEDGCSNSSEKHSNWCGVPTAARGAEVALSFSNPHYEHRFAVTQHTPLHDPNSLLLSQQTANSGQGNTPTPSLVPPVSVVLSDSYRSGPQRHALHSTTASSSSGYTLPAIWYDWTCTAATSLQLTSPATGTSPTDATWSPRRDNVLQSHSINGDLSPMRTTSSSPFGNTSNNGAQLLSLLSTIGSRLSARLLLEVPLVYHNEMKNTDTMSAIFRVRGMSSLTTTRVTSEAGAACRWLEPSSCFGERSSAALFLPPLSRGGVMRGVTMNRSQLPRAAEPSWFHGLSFEVQIPRSRVDITLHWACTWWNGLSSQNARIAENELPTRLAVAGVSLTRRKGLEVGGCSGSEGSAAPQSRISKWGQVIPQRLECGLQWFRVEKNTWDGAPIVRDTKWASGLIGSGGENNTVRDTASLLGGLLQFRHIQCSIVWDTDDDD